MKICYIFGAGDGFPKEFKRQPDDLVIAADGGIIHLNKLGCEPDIALGDFDSLGFIPECREVIKHPVMKNDTDMMLAVKIGFKRGCKRFMLYGGAGGRPDHTFANIQTLTYIAERGGAGFLDLSGFTATVIKNGGLRFSKRARGTVSVFAVSERVEKVSLKGLLYPIESAIISYDFPLGVSNEFTDEEAEIKISGGTALVIWQGNAQCVTDIIC